MLSFRNRTNKMKHASKTRRAINRACVIIGMSTALTVPFTSDVAFAGTQPPQPKQPCQTGQFCYWTGPDYRGEPQVLDLSDAATSTCIPLPNSAEARAFINSRADEITLYESGHCSSEGDFRTYPGTGTQVPSSPFVVRAVEIWNH